MYSDIKAVMFIHTDSHPLFSVETMLHRDPERRLLALRIVPVPNHRPVPPQSLALVIDRSGSMSGERLALAKEAARRMCASLRDLDRVALVAYDDGTTLVRPLARALPVPEREIASIHEGGSTDLYGGWLMGAKALPRYGRVLLLSDGQANAGRYQRPTDLGAQAELSSKHYRITTSTLGIGVGYDERVMDAMARQGWGNAYFAADADAIASAVATERAAMGEIALLHVTLQVDGRLVEIGHLSHGDGRTFAFEVPEGVPGEASLRFTGPERRETLALILPREFGHSDEATLAFYLDRASRALGDALTLDDARSAGRAADRLRSAMMPLMAHPLAEQSEARAAIAMLESAIASAERLSQDYSEEEAGYERKRSAQYAHNVRKPEAAYASVREDAGFLTESAPPMVALPASASLLAQMPLEDWRRLRAYPVSDAKGPVEVAMENPKDGFAVAELEKRMGRRIRAVPADPDAVNRELGG